MLRSRDLAGRGRDTAGYWRLWIIPVLFKSGHRQSYKEWTGRICSKVDIFLQLFFSVLSHVAAFCLLIKQLFCVSRRIAKVVSQVHAFQEAIYSYSPDRELQAYLRRRIARLATSDIRLLAADSDANFQQSSERQTRRIQDTLRRVKANFQWALPQSHLTAQNETPSPG